MILASSKGQGEVESDMGIISGHAYSVIAAEEFLLLGRKVRVLKMRNPWGKTEWKGDWSDESPLWD